MINIQRGLDVPISGAPDQRISNTPPVRQVALLTADYPGIRPSLSVEVGAKVAQGQCLFTDRNNPGVNFVSPAGGEVSRIVRGARRALLAVVVDVEEDESCITFPALSASEIAAQSVEDIRERLLLSGAWTALRTRPFSKVPLADSTPDAIFITAIDTHPLAADPRVAIQGQEDAFRLGVALLTRLAPVHLCQGEGKAWPGSDLPHVTTTTFTGVHPAGLPGTHIHFLRPASLKHQVWHVAYQDVAAIGTLFASGIFPVERVISLAGPVVNQPRLLSSRLGVQLLELTRGELNTEQGQENRVISGSILGGRTAAGETAFLGRYHNQVSCLTEGREREMLHYFRLGFNKHSVMNIFVSKLLGKKEFPLTTSTNGSQRAIVPVGNYEAVMPLDILPTQLLRALVVGDTEMAQKLGCLELDEEDLALCSYVCAGKYEYGPILRDNLSRIEKEG